MGYIHKEFGKEVAKHSYISEMTIEYNKVIKKPDIKTIVAILGRLVKRKGETRVIVEYTKTRR